MKEKIRSFLPKPTAILNSHYLYLMVGRLIPLLTLFAIAILYARRLSYSDYGIFQSIWMYVNILNGVMAFGITAVIFSTPATFLFSFLRGNRRTLLRSYGILWLLVLTGFFLFSRHFGSELKLWIMVFMIIQNGNAFSEALLIKRKGEKKYYLINSVYALLLFGWHLFVLFTSFDFILLMAGLCILSLLKFGILLLVNKSRVEIKETFDEIEGFGKHWIHLGLNDVVGIFSKWIDKLMLVYILTAGEFAIFFNGSVEIPLFGILISVTGSFIMLGVSQDLKNTDRIKSLFKESFLMLSSLVFPLFFFLFFFRQEIFFLFFGHKYDESLPIFAITLWVLPLRINHYSSILQCYSKGQRVLAGSLIEIAIAAILILVLYPVMGMRGAALAVVISTAFQVTYYLWYSHKLLPGNWSEMVPFTKLLLRFAVLGLVFWGLKFLVSQVSWSAQLGAGILLLLILVFAGLRMHLSIFGEKTEK